jgi:hypothetical protein
MRSERHFGFRIADWMRKAHMPAHVAIASRPRQRPFLNSPARKRGVRDVPDIQSRVAAMSDAPRVSAVARMEMMIWLRIAPLTRRGMILLALTPRSRAGLFRNGRCRGRNAVATRTPG